MRGCLIATFWVAVLCAVFAYNPFNPDTGGPIQVHASTFLLVCAPAAAFGALANHPIIGLLCGASSGVVLIVWFIFID